MLITVINQQWHYRYKRNRKKELTFSEFSKSSLNAQSFSLAGNSEMEGRSGGEKDRKRTKKRNEEEIREIRKILENRA